MEEKSKSGREREEKREEAEKLMVLSFASGGSAGGRPRQRGRGGGIAEKDGGRERKEATSHGNAHRSFGISGVG